MVDNFSIKTIGNRMRTDSNGIILPEGRYYLGDPSHVIPRTLWNELMRSDSNLDEGVLAEINGLFLVSFGTAYGDGVYEDQSGRSYPVDSGLIGVISEELIEDFRDKDLKGAPGELPEDNFEDFDSEWVAKENNGVLTFGDVIIDTN